MSLFPAPAVAAWPFRLGGAVLLLAAVSCGGTEPVRTGSTVLLPNGVVYSVEVPLTQQARERGLMFRANLAPRTGMLFIFPTAEPHAIWMKNCLVPLDLIWLDHTRRIIAIHPEAPPCDSDPCPIYNPPLPSRFVLEIPGGAAAREGLKVGSILRF